MQRSRTLTLLPRSTSSSLSFINHSRLTAQQRFFASTSEKSAGSQNSTPDWKGRSGDDHVVNRSENDSQAEASHSGMRAHEKGEEGSDALSRKDERNSNEKAKEEFPEAPGPIIGMNDERGSKGH